MNTGSILTSSDSKIVLQHITYGSWFINGAIWTTAVAKYEKEQKSLSVT